MNQYMLEQARKMGREVRQVSWVNGNEIEYGRYGRELESSAYVITDNGFAWLITFDNQTGKETGRYNPRYIEGLSWHLEAA